MADQGERTSEDDQDSLIRMLLGFGLSELQRLMAFVGKSAAGRMEVLQLVALDLLQTDSFEVKTKIRELHRLRCHSQDIIRLVGSDMSPIGQLPPVGIVAQPTCSYRSPATAAASFFHRTFPPPPAAYNPYTSRYMAPPLIYDNFPPSSYGSSPFPSNAASQSFYSNFPQPSRNTVPPSNFECFPRFSSAVRPPSTFENIPPPILGNIPRPADAAPSRTYHNVPRTINASAPSTCENIPPLHVYNSQVKFKQSPFYQVVAQLFLRRTAVPAMPFPYHQVGFLFKLTPTQATEIAISRSSEGNQCQLQIQLRCCIVDTSCEQCDLFPVNMSVQVNGNPCSLPEPVEVCGVGPRRPSQPIDITALVSPTFVNSATSTARLRNRLLIKWDTNEMPNYAVAVFLVRKLTAKKLLDKLITKKLTAEDVIKKMIQDTLKESADFGKTTKHLRVSLICPLGKRRLEFPFRAGDCTHLQCFDALSFLRLNEQNPTWSCPVCNRLAPYESLYRDLSFTYILTAVEKDCEEILFLEDGSWEIQKDVESTSKLQKDEESTSELQKDEEPPEPTSSE